MTASTAHPVEMRALLVEDEVVTYASNAGDGEPMVDVTLGVPWATFERLGKPASLVVHVATGGT